jgi:hypothetical protein
MHFSSVEAHVFMCTFIMPSFRCSPQHKALSWACPGRIQSYSFWGFCWGLLRDSPGNTIYRTTLWLPLAFFKFYDIVACTLEVLRNISDILIYPGTLSNMKRKSDCEVDGCRTRCHFGFIPKEPKVCGKHRSPGMFNVNAKMCSEKGCRTCPTFALPGQKAQVCALHRTDGMVNVVNPTCKHDGCTLQPSYALPGERRAYCKTHALPTMVNVAEKRKCTFPGCKLFPSFSLPGKKPSRCSAHKTDVMEDASHRKCGHEGCVVRATYGLSNTNKPLRCSQHADANMVDIHNRCR